ncbi:MAG: peptidylprolyl isomerase, partial [Thermoguttaceae bacterium]
HKTFYPSALLSGILIVAVVVRPGVAADPWDSGDNQSNVTPAVPTTAPMSSYDIMRQVVPSAPAQPTAGSRPASWPGGTIPANQPAAQSPAASASSQAPVELFEGTTILGRVGSEAIFANEITGATIVWRNGKKSEGGIVCVIIDGVDEILEQYKEKYKDKIPSSQLEIQRTMMIKERLVNRIESKVIYLDAKQSFPAEHFPEIEKQLDKFFESAALPALYKCCEVKSPRELDHKFRGRDISLDRVKKGFKEWALSQQWIAQQIKRDEEITYDQMVKYYREHLKEFEKPARAQWEELAVLFSKYRGKAEAYDAIARLGNQVLAGVPFAEAAKNGSQGVTAASGGAYGWTTKGSLKFAEIEQAIFGLPEKQLSPIIETEKGYHVIRVTERVETETTPFLTAQVEIKEKIMQERTTKQLQDYLARLENKIYIWTIYDGDRKDIRLSERMKEVSR